MPIIKKHQSLLDFIAQHCGDMEGAWAFVKENGVSIVAAEITPGTELTMPVVVAPKVAGYFINNNMDIATADNPDANESGIGFMQIQNDFIVS